MQKVAVEGSGEPQLRLDAPFLHLSKQQIVKLGTVLGVPFVEFRSPLAVRTVFLSVSIASSWFQSRACLAGRFVIRLYENRGRVALVASHFRATYGCFEQFVMG